mgnify:CR=1 FL=1
MIEKAKEMLPSLHKMERLLGHSFGIGSDTLELHVQKAIDEAISMHGFKISGVNANDVDWQEIIKRSAYREAPFEAGGKEKGFRDAVIAHTFFQVLASSPKTPAICRLVLVSEDQRLQDYVREKSDENSNVRILKNVDELESLINTLVSSIPEDLAKELAEKAQNIFFEENNEKSLYYKNKVQDVITTDYKEALKNSPIKGLTKEGKTWWISPPVFMKKEKSKIYWTSSVEPEFDLYHMEEESSTSAKHLSDILASQAKDKPYSSLLGLGSLLNSKKVVDHTGRDFFEVHWSAVLSTAGNLTKPKIERIDYLGNDLSD